MKNLICVLTLMLMLLSACEDGAPCSLMICANGGTCEAGTCECADGYGGDSCQELALPAAYTLQRVVIADVPQADANGQAFDLTDGPDLYLEIQNLDSGETLTSPTRFENANTGDSYTFELAGGFEIAGTNRIRIELFDDDGGADDPMVELAQEEFSAQTIVLAGGGYEGPYQFEAATSSEASISLVVDWGF